MVYKEIFNQVNKDSLTKKAGIGQMLANGSYLLAAALGIGIAGVSGGAGYLASKIMAPGSQDLTNASKEHRLARLNRDNETQRISEARQDALRTPQKTVKPMRIM